MHPEGGILNRFVENIRRQQLFVPGDRLLLAVSGGIDSVVLCELCHLASFDFVIAHCNFRLRGDESERDEVFTKQLGEKYNKPVLVKTFDTELYAAENKISIQVAARVLRYAWFEELVHGVNKGPDTNPENRVQPDISGPIASWIVTGHHLDDNIETMLMNLFKGTGIQGLRGMLPRQGKIVRPLLIFGKQELVEFATGNQLKWVEDSSNESDKYSRNYIRNQLFPLLQNKYPEVKGNLAANIGRFRDIELLYRQSVDWHKKRLLEKRGSEIHIPVLKLEKSEPLNTIVFEIIKEYGFTSAQVPDIVRLLDSESGKFVSSGSHRILKNRKWLIITAFQNGHVQTILLEGADSIVQCEAGRIKLERIPAEGSRLSPSNSIAMLDADKIVFPLLLRKWKQGDYFYPLGMEKKKKLNRFFIDNKFSRTDKENAWVLEMNKKIVWVVGARIDDRFKVGPQTRSILKMEIETGMF